MQDPVSKLILPKKFIDEKQALKKVIDDLVNRVVSDNKHVKQVYFLVLHAKFDKFDSSQFNISEPVITYKLPPFVSNQLVFWVCPQRGLVELLWITSKKNGKLSVEFNTQGVAYLQAKGAMKSQS